MATYYALPTLTDLNNTVGWSLSSGGSDSGTTPCTSTNDGIVFDAKSGSARTITGNLSSYAMLSLTATNCNAITLSGAVSVVTTINAPALASVASLNISSAQGTLVLPRVIGDLTISSPNAISFGNDVVCGGALRLSSTGTFNFNSKNVTCGAVAGGNTTITNFGPTSCVWTLTGTGDVFTDDSFGARTGGPVTYKVTDTSATAKNFKAYSNSGNGRPYSIWNAASGAGGLNIIGASGFPVNGNTTLTLLADPNTTTRIEYGGGVAFGGFTAILGGIPPTLCTTSAGTTAAIQGSGRGTISGFTLKDLYVNTGSISIIARNCTNNGNLTGFIFQTSRFASFF